jgi:hypothetical protein
MCAFLLREFADRYTRSLPVHDIKVLLDHLKLSLATFRMAYLRGTTVGDLLQTLNLRLDRHFDGEKLDFEPSTASTYGPTTQQPSATTAAQASHADDLSTSSTPNEGLSSKGTPDYPSFQKRGPLVVSWDGDNDKENPRMWSRVKKIWVMLILVLYSFTVYGASSIVLPGLQITMQRYRISVDVAYLNLSVSWALVLEPISCHLLTTDIQIYVLGYALGPMVFSPISEMPTIGRNPPYLYSFIAFTVVSIIIAAIDDISAIIVLRFFQGFFGSPCLASGAATIDDMYELYSWPYGLAVWVMAIFWGPSFAPLLAAYAVQHNIHCE